jgi:hypothetical protein|uniref:WXG100 family type VII secretion target n=1 Tax=candidate division WOR-3 bacterium TaxID=2052148 RepID=A0A7V3NV47_UNCW3
MSQVFSDPEKLKEFANALRVFWQTTEGKSWMLKSKLLQLHETWQDQQYETFKGEFEKAMEVFIRFKKTAEKEEAYLKHSAQELERYQKERLSI